MDNDDLISPFAIRKRAVYEPLLGNATFQPWAGPAVKALLAAGAAYGERDAVMRLIMDRRRWWLEERTRSQRRWQSKVSRRPQRGRHHDSWAIREKYVRCTG